MKGKDVIPDIGNPVAFYPSLNPITGGVKNTLFLCQFLYWTGKEKSRDGWIYKSRDDITRETGLSYDDQRAARKALRERSLVWDQYRRSEHKLYFKVNLQNLADLWEIYQESGELPDFSECD